MKTLAVELAYDGKAYSGFAKQKDPALNTVQGKLEEALSILFRRAVETVCAGRTDAGVHALGQWISFDLSEEELSQTNVHKMTVSLNALTPDDISIKRICMACDGFSARFDAVEREYRYRIVTGKVPPLFLREYAWWHKGSLDIDAMGKATKYLEGEHDFKSFCKKESAVDKNTVRRVNAIELLQEEQMGEECLVIQVKGTAFLHSMVRTIVGTLAEVGAGRKPAEWVREVLDACDRDAAGPNAPACGLTFYKVTYKDGALTDFE